MLEKQLLQEFVLNTARTFFFFLATMRGLRDLSSLTRD